MNTIYYAKSQIDAQGYLPSIQLEQMTESELNSQGYLTSLPTEYITESELTMYTKLQNR